MAAASKAKVSSSGDVGGRVRSARRFAGMRSPAGSVGDGPAGGLQEHKLAYHVALIDGDATVVPRGAYLVDAAHQVIKNPAYEGLAYEAAGQLRSYFHFRAPASERAQMALEKPGIVRAGDFLDPITEDKPAGTFSLYYDPSHTMAIIRSFYWPGSYSYHVIGTGQYGSVYMGDGLPNTDIQFML